MKKNLVSSIVGEIQKQIESGQYPPGTSLPPFRDLAHIHSVSHATIQQAIRELRKKTRYEMGREAAYLLASSIQDSRRTVPAERILRTYLVHRASCATVLKRMPEKKVAAAVV